MPIPTPFFTRTEPLCTSWEWRDWAGYLAPSLYEPYSHEREYYAIRNSAALIDVSPLFKYEVSGPHALALVDRIMPRDISCCAVGQVFYSPWCDAAGKVIDDGTIARLDSNHFRITCAHPNLRWFQDTANGLDAQVNDVSHDLAALALQGPKSRAILKEVLTGIDLDNLKFYHLAPALLDGHPLTVTRTGYTGDLGYELWIRPLHAEQLWDRLITAGQRYNLLPTGMVALDIARIEAGLLLIDIDYFSARKALIEAQKSSPYELGLGWAVQLKGADFVGKDSLRDEHVRGSQWAFVGLEVPWFELERLYNQVNLRPQVAGKRASRTPVPLFSGGRQIGQATSHTFSPILKKYIALATAETEFAQPGTRLEIEMTIEYRHEKANATVVKRPFYDPPHKKQ